MQKTCDSCLYHLPDAEDHVCVEEASPKYGEYTDGDETCKYYHKREAVCDVRQKSSSVV